MYLRTLPPCQRQAGQWITHSWIPSYQKQKKGAVSISAAIILYSVWLLPSQGTACFRAPFFFVMAASFHGDISHPARHALSCPLPSIHGHSLSWVCQTGVSEWWRSTVRMYTSSLSQVAGVCPLLFPSTVLLHCWYMPQWRARLEGCSFIAFAINSVSNAIGQDYIWWLLGIIAFALITAAHKLNKIGQGIRIWGICTYMCM